MMKRNLSQYTSKKITHVMFLMSVLVVYIHFYNLEYISLQGFELENVVEDMISQGIARVAVPLFFMISGYLTFSINGLVNGRCLLNNLPPKINSLFIPYILWNIIYLLFNGIISLLVHRVNIFTLTHILKSVFLYQENGAFWYVFQLMALSMIAPGLYYIYKNKVSATIALLIFFVAYLVIVENTKWFLLPGILFYSIGAIAALHLSNVVEHRRKYISIIATVLFVLLLCWRFSLLDLTKDISGMRDTIAYRVFEFLAPLIFWFAMDVVNIGEYGCNSFEKFSFMIYAIHGMVITIVNAFFSFFDIKLSPLLRLVEYIIAPLVIVLIIVVACSILKKRFPKLYNLISGGR